MSEYRIDAESLLQEWFKELSKPYIQPDSNPFHALKLDRLKGEYQIIKQSFGAKA